MLPTNHPTQRTKPSWPTQLIDLCLIELTNWRWSWRSLLVIATIAPLASMVALGLFARDAGPEALGYIFTGNIVLALMFGTMNSIVSHFLYMRSQGTLDFFATLPISRYTLILAVFVAFFLITLPSVLITMFAGALFLKVSIQVSVFLLLVIPLCAFPLAGLGALIGTAARNPQEGGAFSTFITLILLGLGPVIMPPDRLPPLLIKLGYLSPATYAASAFRQVLLGPLTGRFLWDILFLLGFGLLTFWYAGRKMDWREK